MCVLDRAQVTALSGDMSCDGLHGEGIGVWVVDENVDPHGEAARREAGDLRRPWGDCGGVRSRATPASDASEYQAQDQARQSPEHTKRVAVIYASEQSFAIPSIHR